MSISSSEIIEAARSNTGCPVIHVKSGRQYYLSGMCMFKFEDNWYNSVIYIDGDCNTWCRRFDDFTGFVFADERVQDDKL
jgi:hypothetical protein